MSTTFEVQRICQHCRKEFTARTTKTAYCSHRCNNASLKAKKRAEMIETSNIETRRIKNLPVEELKNREFLTVTQVSKLIGCSRQNVYSLINTGKLKATNILLKKTIVKRSDIDKLFNETEVTKNVSVIDKLIQELTEWKQAGQFDISECYTLAEVQGKYGISVSALQNLIERHKIPKIKKGWFAYVPKNAIDKLLS